jgi:hypothetical protein
MSPRLAVACLALAAVPVAAPAGTLYKCESGQASRYQNAPCPAGTRQTEVANPTLSEQISEGDPKTGTFTPEAVKLRGQLERTIGVLATYPVCARNPAYAKAHDARFAAWKSRNALFIQRLEADPGMRRALENGIALEKKRASDPAEHAKQLKECDGEIAATLAGR